VAGAEGTTNGSGNDSDWRMADFALKMAARFPVLYPRALQMAFAFWGIELEVTICIESNEYMRIYAYWASYLVLVAGKNTLR